MLSTRNLRQPNLPKLNANDFIRSLPDDILLIILAELNIKDQARTSILSSRWKILWTLNTCLNIYAQEFMSAVEEIRGKRELQRMTVNFENAVDEILRMHRGTTLDELNIVYPFAASDTLSDRKTVDRWIKIAEQKQVKSLYLDFEGLRKNPVPLLSLASATFSSLITLDLQHASLTDHIIHSLLCNSPNLLELSITGESFKNLKISGSSLKLERLDLFNTYFDFLEISAPNLVLFSIATRETISWRQRICFKSAPLLTRLACYGLHTWSHYGFLLPQLDRLYLTLSSDFSDEDAIMPHFPVLQNLKFMRVRLFEDDGRGLCSFFRIFKAAPSLHRLSLILESDINLPPEPENFPDHEYLKEVEIKDFSGSKYEIELLLCIAQSCSSLHKIIITSDAGQRICLCTNEESIENAVKKLPSRFIARNANQKHYNRIWVLLILKAIVLVFRWLLGLFVRR